MSAVDPVGGPDVVGGQLIEAYLSPPQLGAVMVPRPRLLTLAVPDRAAPVTIVSGEPASGKTSLLVQLLACDALRHRSPAWLTVPPDTDDEIRFWEYLLAAIDAAAADGPPLDDLRAALQDRQPPNDDWTASLANRLRGPGVPLVVVIDDLHELKAVGAMAALGGLLDITPDDVPVLVATRVTPVWPLADWRMSGRLAEITSRDLAVTLDEAHELLASSAIDVADDDVVRLVDRTEGWLGGVKLATLAIQRQPNPAELIAQFSATHELVSSYLLRAVLDRQDDLVRQFLHDVSVLDTMSADVCDEIRQADDSAELLERCRAANLFVSKVGDTGGLYHLHALVRELLRADLEQCDHSRFVELHRAASVASERAGDIEHAIRHAIAAGDGGRASALVIAHAPELGHQARFDELRRWTSLIRRSDASQTESTTLALVSTLVFGGEGTEALRLLDELEDSPTPEPMWRYRNLLRALAHMVRGDVHLLGDIGRGLAKDAEALPAAERGPAIGVARFLEGVGTFLEGALDDAADLLTSADQPENRPEPPAYIAVRSWAALVAVRRGDSAAAERCIRTATERRDQLAGGDSAAFATALLAAAEMAWERNRLDEASALFARARRSVPPMPWQAVLVECARSRLTVSRGHPHEALKDLSEIGKLALSNEGSMLLRAIVAERAVDVSLRAGAVDAALGWVHTHEQCRVGSLPWATRIRVASAVDDGRLDELIEQALVATEALPRRIDTLLAASVCTDDDGAALPYLAEALRLAEPGQRIRRFLDEGPRITTLIEDLASDPRRSGGTTFSRFFAAEVVDARSRPSAEPPVQVPVVDELVDQLSAREIEVLRLLDAGKSYTEIGTELFVSRNTVKSHVQHIYTKLGTSGRAPAVEMGRRLGLLT